MISGGKHLRREWEMFTGGLGMANDGVLVGGDGMFQGRSLPFIGKPMLIIAKTNRLAN